MQTVRAAGASSAILRASIASSAICWKTPCATRRKEPPSRSAWKIRTPSCSLSWTTKVPGLPPDQRPDQLFALFSKGKSHAGKAGLGLYFCKITVERWGGAIGAETRERGGSRFWFRLPRAAQSTQNDATAPRDETNPWKKKKPHKLKKAEKSLRILVAEDAELNRDLIIELLKKRGHVVEGVADGRQALAALEKHDFDVVLLDEEMPGMTGLQTTAAIRKREADNRKTSDHHRHLRPRHRKTMNTVSAKRAWTHLSRNPLK